MMGVFPCFDGQLNNDHNLPMCSLYDLDFSNLGSCFVYHKIEIDRLQVSTLNQVSCVQSQCLYQQRVACFWLEQTPGRFNFDWWFQKGSCRQWLIQFDLSLTNSYRASLI